MNLFIHFSFNVSIYLFAGLSGTNAPDHKAPGGQLSENRKKQPANLAQTAQPMSGLGGANQYPGQARQPPEPTRIWNFH